MENDVTNALVAKKKLDVMSTIKDGLTLSFSNYLNVLLTVILYSITIWVPYINVGTTIALASLPAELAKGNKINPTFIFDAKYRKNMGEYFILLTLMVGAILIGFLFMFIPGIVIAIAWSLAVLLFVDKNKSALEAIRESNQYTYGNKLNIFISIYAIPFAVNIIGTIINLLFGLTMLPWLMAIGSIIVCLLSIAIIPINLGISAVIYKKLVLEDEPVVEQ